MSGDEEMMVLSDRYDQFSPPKLSAFLLHPLSSLVSLQEQTAYVASHVFLIAKSQPVYFYVFMRLVRDEIGLVGA